MTEIQLPRSAMVVIFAIMFMFVGWVSPVLYATYAPQDAIIDVHEFSAEDTTVDADYHTVCFDRTVYKSAVGETFTELYLVEGQTERKRVEVGFDTFDRYYQNGHTRVVTTLELPDNLKPGKYRYLLIINLQLADGRVERPIAITSEPFYINETAVGQEKLDPYNC